MRSDSPPGAGVALFRLEAGNGLALQEALQSMAEDRQTRCVVVTAGEGSAAREVEPWLLPVLPAPVIFASGAAVAGDLLALALGADIRIGSGGTVYRVPGAAAGWIHSRLERLAGDRLTKLQGRDVPGPELLEAGLVSALSDDPVAEGERLAGAIAARGPLAEELGKEALWRGLELPLIQGLRLETDLTLLLQTTKDRAEGVRAFLEKREPVFKGE